MTVRHDPRRFLTFFGAGLLSMGVSLGAAPTATADVATDTTTWSVRPAGPAGADGRTRVEKTLEPGTTVTEYLQIDNLGRQDVTFSLNAADGYLTPSGRFTMNSADHASTDAGRWITTQPTIAIPGDASAVVPYVISIPSDAAPGDHMAGIAAVIRSDRADSPANPLTVESRVGFRVLLRITGDYAPAMNIDGSGGYEHSWNPFEPGALHLRYNVENTGNVRVTANPVLRVSTFFGLPLASATMPSVTDIAPGERRNLSTEVPGIWPWWLLIADMDIGSTPLPIEGDLAAHPTAALELPSTTSLPLVAIPLPQIVALLILASLASLWIIDRRRRRGWEEKVLHARELGRHDHAHEQRLPPTAGRHEKPEP